MPEINPLDSVQSNTQPEPAITPPPVTPPSPIADAAMDATPPPEPFMPPSPAEPAAPFTPLDPSGQPMPPASPTVASLAASAPPQSFGTPPSFNPDAGPSPLTSTVSDPTPSNVYGSLDRPATPTVQTHEGPMPLPGAPGNPLAQPSEAHNAKEGPEDHRTYLLFLIGLGVIFFIVLAIAYLTRPH